MARFDVHRIRGFPVLSSTSRRTCCVTCARGIVIPLAHADEQAPEAATRLRPRLMVAGVEYVLNTPEMAAIPCAVLDEHISNLEDQHHAIVDAIDFLMQGF